MSDLNSKTYGDLLSGFLDKLKDPSYTNEAEAEMIQDALDKWNSASFEWASRSEQRLAIFEMLRVLQYLNYND